MDTRRVSKEEVSGRRSLEDVLLQGGAGNRFLAEGDVVIKVRIESEEAVRKDVEELEPELKRKVRVVVVDVDGGEET